MEPIKTDQPAPHAGEIEKATGQLATPKDADSPASKPQGTLHDQVTTMESEGQAQPQADEVPPEERPSKGLPPIPEPTAPSGPGEGGVS
jgi:hypothetical protein